MRGIWKFAGLVDNSGEIARRGYTCGDHGPLPEASKSHRVRSNIARPSPATKAHFAGRDQGCSSVIPETCAWLAIFRARTAMSVYI